MFTRIMLLFGLPLAVAAGAIAIVHQMTDTPAPAPPAASKPAAQIAPAAPAAPQPAEPAQQSAALQPAVTPPVVTAPPIAEASPVATTPPADTTPPVASIPPPDTTPPVASIPADTSPPVASAPSAEPQAPVADLPTPVPPEKPKKDSLPAKLLFAAKQLPSIGKAMAIGYYPRGCLSGGVALPTTGATWQVMRLSRNRNWGHPSLVKFLEKFAPAAAKATGWKGILVGDMAQPRGGPLPFGHLSHQIGLDVDIWFMPMPDHVLSNDEREKISASNLVAEDWKHLDPKTWTPQHIEFIKTAAEQPEVERVLVNAAIKQELCRVEEKNHPGWLAKVRPWFGHHDHIHVRLKCPDDSPNCRHQPPVPGDDGCSKAELAHWFSDKVLNTNKSTVSSPNKPSKGLSMAELPPACKTVLDAPDRKPVQISGH